MQEPSIRHKPHPPAISSQWQLHHVAPLDVVVVPDLVGEQCNLGQPCIIAYSKTFDSMESRPFI